MSHAITPIQVLNTTTAERSYEERQSVKAYQSALNQLVSHTAKTEISDLRIKKYGVEPKPATGPNDYWNRRAKRSNELDHKIQAFYEALKKRVELVQGTDSAKQAELYRAGLIELRSKIKAHPSKMHLGIADYLISKIRDRALSDTIKKITPSGVARQQLKPVARAIDCFGLAFAPEASQEKLSQVIREEIRYAHADAFEQQIDVLLSDIEERFAAVEAQIESTKTLLTGLAEDFEKCSESSQKQKKRDLYIEMCAQLESLYKEWEQLDTQEKPRVEEQLNYLLLFTKESTVDSRQFVALTYRSEPDLRTNFTERLRILQRPLLQEKERIAGQLAPIEAQIQKVDFQIKEVEKRINELNSEARALTHQIPTLKRMASENRGPILVLHRRAYSHPWYKTYNDTEYSQAVSQLQKQDELRKEINTAQESLTALAKCKTSLTTGKQTLADLHTELQRLRREKSRLKQRSIPLQEAVRKLDEQLTSTHPIITKKPGQKIKNPMPLVSGKREWV